MQHQIRCLDSCLKRQESPTFTESQHRTGSVLVLSEVGKSSRGHSPGGHCQLLHGCENLLITPPASQLSLILFPSTKQPKNLMTDAPGETVLKVNALKEPSSKGNAGEHLSLMNIPLEITQYQVVWRFLFDPIMSFAYKQPRWPLGFIA